VPYVDFVIQILERKNAEIEEIKQHYRTKSQEQENLVNQMEKKGRVVFCELLGITAVLKYVFI
jgi:hypothetical protein